MPLACCSDKSRCRQRRAHQRRQSSQGIRPLLRSRDISRLRATVIGARCRLRSRQSHDHKPQPGRDQSLGLTDGIPPETSDPGTRPPKIWRREATSTSRIRFPRLLSLHSDGRRDRAYVKLSANKAVVHEQEEVRMEIAYSSSSVEQVFYTMVRSRARTAPCSLC